MIPQRPDTHAHDPWLQSRELGAQSAVQAAPPQTGARAEATQAVAWQHVAATQSASVAHSVEGVCARPRSR